MNSEEHDRLGLAIQLKYIQIEGRFFGKFNLGLLPTEPDLSQASCQVAYHDSYSVTTPTTANGRLIFGIFAALAEFEAELIRERTKAGLAAARARGRLGGRPRKITIETLKMANGSYGRSQDKSL